MIVTDRELRLFPTHIDIYEPKHRNFAEQKHNTAASATRKKYERNIGDVRRVALLNVNELQYNSTGDLKVFFFGGGRRAFVVVKYEKSLPRSPSLFGVSSMTCFSAI